MATVTVYTAERMLEIENTSVVDGEVDGSGNLILTQRDGTEINAGSVIGPTGATGPYGGAVVISDLTDVDTAGVTTGKLLVFNGTNWIPGTRVVAANDLSDVDTVTTPPTTGKLLVFNGTNWVPGTRVVAANDLSDVDTVTTPPTTGQAMVFDGTNWVPGLAGLSLASIAGSLSKADSVSAGQARGVVNTWGDLATVGPVVSMVTGTEVWIELNAELYNPVSGSASYIYMGVEISGATSYSPNTSSPYNLYEGPMTYAGVRSYGYKQTVTAGTNVFTTKYNAGGTNSPTWGLRHLRVTRLN